MSVYKDEKGRGTWYVVRRYTDWNGERKQHKKRGFATKREAQEYEINFVAKHSGACKGLTLQSLYDLYIVDCEARLRPSSLHVLKYRFTQHILPDLGHMDVSQITPAIIRKWQLSLKSKGFAPGSIKSDKVCLSTLFNFGVNYYNVPSNPVRQAGLVIPSEPRKMTIWGLDEFNKFLSVLKPRNQLYFKLLFYTGMRIGELTALTWGDIEGNIIHVTKSYNSLLSFVGPCKTKTSNRDIVIPQFLVDELQIRPYGWQPEDRIVVVDRATLTSALRRGAIRAGVPSIRIHDLRHSHASYLIKKNVPITAVSRRLGHANSEITMRVYAHAYKEDISSIADLLDDAQIKKDRPEGLPNSEDTKEPNSGTLYPNIIPNFEECFQSVTTDKK